MPATIRAPKNISWRLSQRKGAPNQMARFCADAEDSAHVGPMRVDRALGIDTHATREGYAAVIVLRHHYAIGRAHQDGYPIFGHEYHRLADTAGAAFGAIEGHGFPFPNTRSKAVFMTCICSIK